VWEQVLAADTEALALAEEEERLLRQLEEEGAEAEEEAEAEAEAEAEEGEGAEGGGGWAARVARLSVVSAALEERAGLEPRARQVSEAGAAPWGHYNEALCPPSTSHGASMWRGAVPWLSLACRSWPGSGSARRWSRRAPPR
jgi:hypothetical protein